MLLAVHHGVTVNLGSLESAQEARVARGDILRFFRSPNFLVHAKTNGEMIVLFIF